MANSLNQCQFIGRLGRDPEVKHTTDGNAVTNISIAVDWKSKNGEGTEWVPIVFFGKLAEVVGQHLHKGDRIFVAGRFRTRKWQGDDGKDRYSTEIVASEMQMLGGRSGSQNDAPREPRQGQTATEGGEFDDFDSGIPF